MYYCSNYTLAVLLCVVTMLCWGSWGNTQKLAGRSWRYELFYWDYVIGLLLFSVLAGVTLGSSGPQRAWGFVANLKASFGANALGPFLGGIVFNASNILLAAAIAVAGMSVAFPVGVGLALVGGTVANYFVDGKGNPTLIWTGLALIVASIVCNALAFRAKQAGAGAADSPRRVRKGLALAVLAGLLMSWFSPLVNRAVDLSFLQGAAAPAAGKLTPYTGFFVFALGVFASNFVFNTLAMRRPVAGEPVRAADWFKGSLPIHLVGVLGGAIWATGTLLSFVTAGTAGAAISYALGQGATLVSALWGILVWKEFAGAPRRAHVLNGAMLGLFVAGLACLVKAGDAKAEPVRVIFDTDMITDFDDVGALACLHALADAGECEILATVSNTRGNASIGAIQVINGYYGRADLPVGAPKGMGILGAYPGAKEKVDPAAPLGEAQTFGDGGHHKYRKLIRDYPQAVTYPDADQAPDANVVYRRALADAPDKSVVICSVGFLTNLRRLLETAPDAISPLDGKALVDRKVNRLVAMACNYPDGAEYNSRMDAESSRIVLSNWPTLIVFSDFQYGYDVYAGRAVAEMPGPRNPVKDVFVGNIPSRDKIASNPAEWRRHHFGEGGRCAWDETAVLAAVRGTDLYFNAHRGTYRMVGDKGDNEWIPDEANGRHLRLTEKLNKVEVGRIIDELMCRPPQKR